MQIIAHRGWSIGEGDGWVENTIEAFIKSSNNKNINGVEIDIRRNGETGEIVLSHDPVRSGQNPITLEDALDYISKQDWELIIELKEYDKNIILEVNKLLQKYNLSDRTLLFGFFKIAKEFEWGSDRPTNLGIIIEYPWQISKIVSTFNPNTILLGWDDRKWTKIAFKIWWSIFSLRNLTKKYNARVVVGVTNSTADIDWLERQGIDMATSDVHYSIA